MMQHIMLSYYKRINYQLTIGGLFERLKKEIVEIDLVTRLLDIFKELVNILCEGQGVDFIEFYQDIMRNEKLMAKFNSLIPVRIMDNAA